MMKVWFWNIRYDSVSLLRHLSAAPPMTGHVTWWQLHQWQGVSHIWGHRCFIHSIIGWCLPFFLSFCLLYKALWLSTMRYTNTIELNWMSVVPPTTGLVTWWQFHQCSELLQNGHWKWSQCNIRETWQEECVFFSLHQTLQNIIKQKEWK